MKIEIATIPDEGLALAVGPRDRWAVDAASRVLEAEPTDLDGELTVRRLGELVTVGVRVSSGAPRDCERCGESTPLALSASVELAYVPAPAPVAGAEVELGEGDLDVGWYRDGVVVLGDVLSEALALELPSRIVCADGAACEARTASLLAPRGGVDEPLHPAFAALKDFR